MTLTGATVPTSAVHRPVAGVAPPPGIGGKALGLLAIEAAGLETPGWFVVLPGSVAADGRLDARARAEIECAWSRLVDGDGADQRVAVRSSALDEDAADRSFAGQYRSELPLEGLDQTLAAIRRCARPVVGSGQMAYRTSRAGTSPEPTPAVIVQRYVHPRSAGVAFSRDPVTGDRSVVIAAAREVGAVTGGAADGDEYRTGDRGEVRVVRLDPAGGGRVLPDDDVRAVARAARLLERQRGSPQDIEWAIDRAGRLTILQTRPITSLPASASVAAADRQIVLWDNANIVESFPEITLPLTFSIAVELYAAVYRGFCRAVGVPPSRIEREARTFDELLGRLHGRVYYNVNNWYRVLSLLPGFGRSAGYLEAMMGAARPGGQEDEHAVLRVALPAGRRVRAAMAVRLAWRFIRLGGDVARFRTRLAGILAAHRSGSGVAVQEGAGSPDVLLAEYEQLRATALADWRAPIVNDVCLMFVHGALRRAASKWLGRDAQAIVNALLAEGGVSARSGQDLARIGATIRARPEWSAVVREAAPEDLRARVAADPALVPLARAIDAYLEAWADRAPRELQLERPTFREDPRLLLRSLRSLADAAPGRGIDVAQRPGAEARRRLLRGPIGPIRMATFAVLLRLTRRQIRWREEMRLTRGQVFGVGRRIFRELGLALSARGALGAADDVHYLTVAELRRIVPGPSAPRAVRRLVRARRARQARYAALPRLPNRLETRGPAVDPLVIVPPASNPGGPAGEASRTWRGVGAAIGRARGRCLVVLDPTGAEPVAGRIVVAHSTDPGWVPILAGAAGLAVEQGSLLSHSAIVARELGIPTVVGLPGLLERVHDGDVLELDGSTGEVSLVGAGRGP